ncbi:DUF177 domain-containing protein [Tropicimonas sp. IMCC34011]|uniref:YceD family protein n=1 Tax=Tropicimonas sp. IMCC34011 TaxID=2248759 RepID=UPI000E2857DF|nr:DUF177 domain-containing protein [Tropicimonas sp. IMCC34011]
MSEDRANDAVMRLSSLPRRDAHKVSYAPDEAGLEAIRERLKIEAVTSARLEGQLIPAARRDWRLEATLTARAVQACVVTGAPVETVVSEKVVRRYVEDWSEPEESEVEMPQDDTAEPLPAMLDLSDVLGEALDLALPEFPRAEGAELGEAVFAAPGVEPMRDEDARPFAALKALREGGGESGSGGPH